MAIMCPECGAEMSQGLLPFQSLCPDWGKKTGRGIPTGNINPGGKHQRDNILYPERHKAVIYCTPLLWASKVCPDVIEFEFAIAPATWGMKNNGYKYQLVSIFAANGFPWPTDLAEAMRKYSEKSRAPLTKQLRDAISEAIAKVLGVDESEIKYLKTEIARATTTLREERRKRREEDHAKNQP